MTLKLANKTVEQVRRWGGATTDSILDPSTRFFVVPNIDGFIGYRVNGNCVIVFGDPICAKKDRDALTLEFHRSMEKEGKSIIYIATSQAFAYWAIENVCGTLIEFGKELVFHIPCDPREKTGTHASLVRRKVKQAIREGVTIHEYTSQDEALEDAIEEAGDEWLKSRNGPQIHISNVYLFDDRQGKRWFYAQRNDQIVGIIVLNQLQARNGWLINHLMVTPKAPNGTPELLVVSILETLANEGCTFATVGMIAGTELGEIRGLNQFHTWLARILFRIIGKVMHLDGLNTFWGKYFPDSEPSYLLFSRNRIGLQELLSLKHVLTGKN